MVTSQTPFSCPAIIWKLTGKHCPIYLLEKINPTHAEIGTQGAILLESWYTACAAMSTISFYSSQLRESPTLKAFYFRMSCGIGCAQVAALAMSAMEYFFSDRMYREIHDHRVSQLSPFVPMDAARVFAFETTTQLIYRCTVASVGITFGFPLGWKWAETLQSRAQ